MATTDYLVTCGLTGVIAPYRATESLALGRGEPVVVQSQRGLELGEVVCPASARHAAHFDTIGALLRRASRDDLAAGQALSRRASELLQHGGEVAQALALPVALVDAEILLDGKQAVVLYLHWGDCDIRDLVRPLSTTFDLTVALTDLTAPAHEGCGSCGSGGCGSGGCGSPSQDELRAYFAGLREKFERRVSLL